MLELIRPDWTGRLQNVSLAAAGLAIDALVVSTPANLRYLTGFDGSSGLLIRTQTTSRLLVDGRYEGAVRTAQASGRVAEAEVAVVQGGFHAALATALAGLEAQRVGFEAGYVTVSGLEQWRRSAPDVEWVSTEGIVERLRLVKDRTEVALLRRGGKLISAVAGELRQLVRPGRTEREIAQGIDIAIGRAGFSAPAFPTIVASGPNSAHPHARPTSRRLTAGDLVVLDFGGVLDGYCVDLTRMAAVGAPSAQARALFDAVHEAQRQAVSVIRPGLAASDVDAAARAVLEARGLGSAFVHATGHGLGLDVHEAPRIGRIGDQASEVLEAGMVFTVEPGAYVEGVAGVRLEDDMLVVEGGVESLTDAPRELLIT